MSGLIKLKKGQRFGKHIVIKFAGFGNKKIRRSQYLCKCDCGNENIVRASCLISGQTISCGCLTKKAVSKAAFKGAGVAGFNILIRSYKNGAKRRNLEFLLSDDELFKFFKQNCVICGVEPKQVAKPSERKYVSNELIVKCSFYYNGIDRIDNKKGYILENCRTMCKNCNYAKHKSTNEEFEDWLKRIRNFK